MGSCQIKMADNEPQNNAEIEVEEEIDCEEGSEDAPQTGMGSELTDQLMQNPSVLAALQDRLDSIVGTPSTYIQNLPKSAKRRIKALKKIQFETTKVEAEF